MAGISVCVCVSTFLMKSHIQHLNFAECNETFIVLLGTVKVFFYCVSLNKKTADNTKFYQKEGKNMLIPVLLFLVGIVLLIKGGDWFVDGATGIAHRFHIPEILIGATIVSIGTTLPEVMVSAGAALSGHGEIAYGNAIGSIICNTSLIAAITIAVRPSAVNKKPLVLPIVFFFIAAIVYSFVAYFAGFFSRAVGIVLVSIFVVYMVISVIQAKKSLAEKKDEEETAVEGSLWKELICWWTTERLLPRCWAFRSR